MLTHQNRTKNTSSQKKQRTFWTKMCTKHIIGSVLTTFNRDRRKVRLQKPMQLEK